MFRSIVMRTAAIRRIAPAVPRSLHSHARSASSLLVGRVQIMEIAFTHMPAMQSHVEPADDASASDSAIALHRASSARIEDDLPILTSAQLSDAAQRQKLFDDVAAAAADSSDASSSSMPPSARRFLVNKKLLPSLFGVGGVAAAPQSTLNLAAGGTIQAALPASSFSGAMHVDASTAASSAIATAADPGSSLAALSASAPSAPLSLLVSGDSATLRRRSASTAVAPKPSYRAPSDVERTWLDAATAGDWVAMQRVMQTNPATLDVNIADPRTGASALHQLAALGADAAISSLLAAAGSRLHLDARASNLATPLHWAAGNGHPSTVSLLLRAGADPCLRSVTWNHTVFGRGSGQTPAHWAAESGHLACVQILHEASPATAAMLDERQSSPLESAQKAAQTEVARFLTKAQAEEYVCVEINMKWSGERIVQAPHQNQGGRQS